MYINCKWDDCVINCLSNSGYFYAYKLVFTMMGLTIHRASSRDRQLLIEGIKLVQATKSPSN